MLNTNEVKALFEREAILIGHTDAVPEYVAEKLFGVDAVTYTKRMGKGGIYFNAFGMGDYSLMYLTYKGFQIAATYRNVVEAQGLEDALRGSV